MSQEQLYASFLLDKQEGQEIALLAEKVTEATAITSSLRKLPTTVEFLEGIMHLRDAAIPVINLKKRMGLENTSYDDDAKVAVVTRFDQRFGLLFDDIKEVFRADNTDVFPISSGLQTEDKLISSLLQLDQGGRTVELLDLDHVFDDEGEQEAIRNAVPPQETENLTYTKYVVFRCLGQHYGVPVELAQEITFIDKVDDRYQEDSIDGIISLRGNSIPVIGAKYLLADCYEELHKATEDYRVLIFNLEDCTFGLIVEDVREILNIPDQRVLPIPMENENIVGVYEKETDDNIMLLNIEKVISKDENLIRSKYRYQELADVTSQDDLEDAEANGRMHHLITENGYLVFSIGKHFGMEIKDVQEILDNAAVMRAPGVNGAQTGVINLRGDVIPVVSLRKFLDYPGQKFENDQKKHIICRGAGRTVALEVDSIVTIYKQEQFHMTPSLNPEWAKKKDVLDRLIEFLRDDGLREHVLIININNLVENHFSFVGEEKDIAA